MRTSRRAPRRTRAPARRYSSSSGHEGQPERRIARLAAEHVAPAHARTAAPPPRAPTGSAPPAPAAPTASRATAASGRCRSATAPRFRRRRGDRRRRSDLAAHARSASPCQGRSRSRQPSASHSSSPASRLNGAGSDGHRSRLRAPCAIDELDVELRLQPHPVGRCRSSRRNAERLVVAAQQHVLAVVDALAGLGIGESDARGRRGRLWLPARSTRAPRADRSTAARRPATPAPITMTSGWSFQFQSDDAPSSQVDCGDHRLPRARARGCGR